MSTLKVGGIQSTTGKTSITVAANGNTTIGGTCTFSSNPSGISVASIGVGQTWTDVTSSRAKDTEYQNTTGVPIMVSIFFTCPFTNRGQLQVSSSSGSGFLIIADSDGGDYYSASQGTEHYATITAIIPNKIYYKITSTAGFTLKGWRELR